MVSWLVPWRLGGLRSLTFAQCRANSCFASPRRERVTRLTCESVMVTVCVYARRRRLARKAIPKASISSAQNGNTGQKPITTNTMLKANENRQVATKKSLVSAAVSEQLGASTIRVSMGGKNNPGRRSALLFGKRARECVRCFESARIG